MNLPSTTPCIAPSLFTLGASFIYELLTVIALSLLLVLVFLMLFGNAQQGLNRLLLQVFLWCLVGIYYVRCWTKSGQTLAMKAWRLRIINHKGHDLSLQLALIRYVLASLGLVCFGLGFLWAVLNQQHLYLHDYLLKTRVVKITTN
ncbi:MAG: RDD family protein [Methylotenera sp.]|nr:RDD family protein [Methylotenera sp.]